MQDRRRHIASACLALVVLPLLLLLGIQAWQYRVRQEMKEKLETAELQTLRLPEDRLVWEKPGKEIRLGKQLFDIKTIRLEKGVYLITGLFDHQEAAIKNWLADHSSGQGSRLLLGLLLIAQTAALLPLLPAIPAIGSRLLHFPRLFGWHSASWTGRLFRPPARMQCTDRSTFSCSRQ